MLWVVVDVALCLAALIVLGVVSLRLWRRVKALGSDVAKASERVARASDALAAAQDASRPPQR